MMKLNLPVGAVLSAIFSFLFEKLAGETERLFAGVSRATLPSASAVPAPMPARPRPARVVSRGARRLQPALAAAVIGALIGLGVAGGSRADQGTIHGIAAAFDRSGREQSLYAGWYEPRRIGPLPAHGTLASARRGGNPTSFGIVDRVPVNFDSHHADGHSIDHTSHDRIGRPLPSRAGSKRSFRTSASAIVSRS